ncbi:MAG: hypothetical protein MOGMAGMI_01977 [Candidatus Omnitrophica bacterium]|nr:hypothetical protein [Candidatus Omnitrophota bacterium]
MPARYDWSVFDQPPGKTASGEPAAAPKRKYDWDALAQETLKPARKPVQEGAGQALPPENEVMPQGIRIEGPQEPGYKRFLRGAKETAESAAAGVASGTIGLSESLYRLPEAAARTAAGGLDTFTTFKKEAAARLGDYAAKYKLPAPKPESIDAFLTPFSPVLAKSQEVADALRIAGPLVGRGEIAGKKYGLTFRGRKFGGLSDVADEIHLAQTLLPELHPAFKRNADLAAEADLGMTELLQGRPERMKNVVMDPRAWAGFIGQAVPSLVTAAASGGSLGVMGVMEALDTANDAADFEKRTGIKMSDAEFAQALVQTGAINAKLEAIGLGQVLKKVPARPFLKAIMQRGAAGITEGVTEALQQFNSNWAKKLSYDPSQSLAEGIVPSAMGGMGSGVAFGGRTEAVESGTQAGEGQPNVRIEGPKPSPVELLDSLAETIKEDPNLSPVRKDALIEIVWENRKELMEYFADDRKSPEEILRRIQEIESKNHDQRDPVTQEVVKPAEAISGDEAVESEVLKQDLKVGNHKPSEATMQEKVLDQVAGAIVEGFDQEARSAVVETRMIARKARKSKGPIKGKQTIVAEVRRRGGLTMKSIKAAGYTYQDFKEFGLLGVINNKTGQNMDFMANALLGEDAFRPGKNEGVLDAFMRHLKEKATLAYADAADEMEAEYEKKYQEYVERYGEPEPGEVREADRTAQAQAQSEILSETGGEDAFLDPDEVAGVLRQLDLEEEARGITQKDIVKEIIAKEPKSIKEIAQVTGILEPNVRRILGVGAKDGTFTRVDKGVYVLRQAGQDIAYIQAADASETLPKLVDEGMQFDAVLLDIPYDTPAVRGGNRGANRQYNLMSVDSWRKIAGAIVRGLRTDESPVYYMYSQAKSGMAAMQKYNDVLGEVGLKPVARGEYTKLQLDGVTQVRNMRGDVVLPEGIILLTRSGQFTEKAEARNLNFKLIRPRGYSTEKPAEMIRSLIMQGTDEGDWVLDPTAGSGVTPAEAVRAGRRAIALEINPDVVENRIIPRVEAALRERERMPKYKRIAREFGPKKGSPEAIIEAAKKEFGTTPYFEGAGYMTPDGELLDFSEQNDGGDAFTRSLDHRAIERILPKSMLADPVKVMGARSRNMFKFMELGNIRLQLDGFQAIVRPTPAQERALARFIRQLQEGGFDVNIDVGTGDEARSFSFGTEMSPASILEEVRIAFDETYPKYKTIAPPFFSALERVITEKMPNAAPASMVKNLVDPAKGSGVSQGELDWVGLDQFLEGKEKVTKDEVLAFIAANGIKIREIVKRKGILSPEAEVLKKASDDAAAKFTEAHDSMKRVMKQIEAQPKYQEAYNAWKNLDIEREPIRERARELVEKNDNLGFDFAREAMGAIQEDDFSSAFPDAPAELKTLGRELRRLNKEVSRLRGVYNDLIDQDPAYVRAKETKDLAEIAAERARKAFVQEANKDEPEHERHTEPGGTNYQELLLTLVDPDGGDIFSGPGAHFKEANILVHVRMKDRVDADGNKVLFLEEVQSDWHQEGREQGYKSKYDPTLSGDEGRELRRLEKEQGEAFNEVVKKAEAAGVNADSIFPAIMGYLKEDWEYHKKDEFYKYRPFVESSWPIAKQKRLNELSSKETELRRASERPDAVPDAPFKKNWHEFAMKRMLRWAAQHGYQKLAWTTGTMQAERWNQLSEIADVQVTTSKGKGSRGWGIEAHSSDGGLEVSQWVNTRADLEKLVGKELADVIAPMEGKPTSQVLAENHPLVKDYEGAILVVPETPVKIGGEGMKGFYDKMLVDFLNKYTKKWGAKVGQVELPIPVGTGKGRLRFEVHDPEGNVYDAFETRQAAEEAAKNAGKDYYVAGKSFEDVAVHSIDITPAMFDSVIHEGQKFSTGYTKAAGEKIRLTVEAKKLVNELLPEANLKFEPDMIELPGGEMAVGMWFRDTVHLVMGQGPDIAAHEVVHGFLDKFATTDEKRAVLNEAKKNWGAKDDRDAEEMVADGFWEYLNKKRQGKPANVILGHRLSGAIQRFFERVYNLLRRFFDKSYDGAIRSLYDSILERRRPARRPDRIYTGFAESLRAKKAPERGGEPRRVKDILEGLKSIESKKSETTGGSQDEIQTPADAKQSASLYQQVRDLFDGGDVPPGKVTFAQGAFEGLKDITSFAIGARDAFRNFEAVFSERYPDLVDRYMYALVQSNAARVDMDRAWLERLKNEVVALGIKKGSKESAAVQNYGEGNITFNDLVNQFGIEGASKIRKADEWFRSAYDELLDRVNGAMRRIYPNRPDKQIPRRKSYYRHFREFSELSGLKTIFETPANISSQLAGITQHTKPKSRWLSFAQQRLGLATKVDAVGGFLDYLPAASYATHVSPHIVKFRQLAKSLRDATEGSNNLNNFIEFLEDYANDLAGKSSPLDRVLIKYIPGGRKTLRLLDWFNNRTKANVILANASSSLAQLFNVPQGIGHAKQYSVVGAGDSLAQIFKPSEAMAKSAFLKARYADRIYDQFDEGLLRNTKNFANWMMTVGDEIGTRFIWNSMYRQAQGKKIADPVKYADDWTRKMVAGRSVGEVPLLQKSKYFQVVAPFQLEVGNLWWVIGDEVKKKDFVSLIIFAWASFLFNEVAEKVRGNRVSLDIIDAMRDAFTGEKTVEQRVGRLAGEVISNVPLGQTVAAAWPEYGFKVNGYQMPTRKQLFGEGDPTRFGSGLLVVRGLQDPGFKLAMPFGGMQVKRSMEGIDAWKKGYVVINRKQVFFEQDTENLARAFLFGKYAIPEIRDYMKRRDEKSQERYMAKRRARQ